MQDEHWLWRLDARAWIQCAQVELRLAEQHRRSRRRATTHCRRAAGMALNAALVALRARGGTTERCETMWGRSYLDHLREVGATGADLSPLSADAEHVAAAAQVLLRISPDAPDGLVRVGTRGPAGVHEATQAARTIIAACQRMLEGQGSAGDDRGGA